MRLATIPLDAFLPRRHNLRMAKRTYLTVSDAARRLGVSSRTVQRMLNDGRLKGRRVSKGNRLLWTVSEASVLRLGDIVATRRQATSRRENDAILAELTALRSENEQMREQIALLSRQVARLLPAPPVDPPRLTILQRLSAWLRRTFSA